MNFLIKFAILIFVFNSSLQEIKGLDLQYSKKIEECFLNFNQDDNDWRPKFDNLINLLEKEKKYDDLVLALITKRSICKVLLEINEIEQIQTKIEDLYNNVKLSADIKLIIFFVYQGKFISIDRNQINLNIENKQFELLNYFHIVQFYYYSLLYPNDENKILIKKNIDRFLNLSKSKFLKYKIKILATYIGTDPIDIKIKKFNKLIDTPEYVSFCPGCQRILQLFKLTVMVKNNYEIEDSAFDLIENEKIGAQTLGVALYYIATYFEKNDCPNDAIKFFKKKYDLSLKNNDAIGVAHSSEKLFSLLLKGQTEKYNNSGFNQELKYILKSDYERYVEEINMVLDLVSRKGFGIDEISKVNNSVVEAWILSHINSSTLKQKNEDLNKQNNGSSNFLNIYTWGSISLILLSILLILKIRKLLQSSRI